MKATIFDLGGGIGVCHFRRENLTYVAEITMDEKRVLPQSVREVRAILHQEVGVDEETTAQDHIDRATQGLKRFRARLETFDIEWVEEAELREWAEQAIGARDELVALIHELRKEKGVG